MTFINVAGVYTEPTRQVSVICLKMKVLLVILVLCVCTFAEETVYNNSRYSGIDVDAILNNKRILQSYINCLLDKGPCTPDGRDAKKYLPEIYKNNCSKCSDEQKALVRTTVKKFIAKRKDDWEKIVDKYDPEHKKKNEFIKWVNAE